MGTQNYRYGSIGDLKNSEAVREKMQKELECCKSIEYRREEGQFSTPLTLAREIVDFGLDLSGKSNLIFLEPSMGTGVFLTALFEKACEKEMVVDQIVGIEKDKDFYEAAQVVWKFPPINLINTDFIIEKSCVKADLIITNPPYVRHHYLSKEYKEKIKKNIKNHTGIQLSGLAGLYCYFMLDVRRWMKPNAICGLLVPSEFMDVKYGNAVKDYLLHKVHLLKIHRYDPEETKFSDAMVSSCVVWFKNEIIEGDYDIEFSYGDTLQKPEKRQTFKKSDLEQTLKWTQVFSNTISSDRAYKRIGDFFQIKRGLATGDNDFFIMTKEKIEELQLDYSLFKPILPSPRYLKVDEVERDVNGYPNLEKQYFLLDCHLDEADIREHYPRLWAYLETGAKNTAQKYLCKSRKKMVFSGAKKSNPLSVFLYGQKYIGLSV